MSINDDIEQAAREFNLREEERDCDFNSHAWPYEGGTLDEQVIIPEDDTPSYADLTKSLVECERDYTDARDRAEGLQVYVELLEDRFLRLCERIRNVRLNEADGLVDIRYRCPRCGEATDDWLVIDETHSSIICEACGLDFKPGIGGMR